VVGSRHRRGGVRSVRPATPIPGDSRSVGLCAACRGQSRLQWDVSAVDHHRNFWGCQGKLAIGEPGSFSFSRPPAALWYRCAVLLWLKGFPRPPSLPMQALAGSSNTGKKNARAVPNCHGRCLWRSTPIGKPAVAPARWLPRWRARRYQYHMVVM